MCGAEEGGRGASGGRRQIQELANTVSMRFSDSYEIACSDMNEPYLLGALSRSDQDFVMKLLEIIFSSENHQYGMCVAKRALRLK